MKKGIITSTDSKSFDAFKLFFNSLKKHNPKLPLVVFNLGLCEQEIKWCEKNKINIKNYKNPIVPKDYFMWQTWNKPDYINRSEFDYTLWIDCDTIIYGSLDEIFKKLKKQIFIVRDYFGCDDLLSNNPELYIKFPVKKRLKTLPNGGVLGLCKSRKKDARFLKKYLKMTKRVSKNRELSKLFSWWDQGVIHWSLEKSKNTKCVNQSREFNDALYDTNLKPKNEHELYERLKKRNSKIVHLGGSPKPYFWFENQNKLKIFVLGHDDECLKKVEKLDFVEKINLEKINVDAKPIAESRFFLSDHIYRCNENYIGTLTHRYKEKYNINLSELKNLQLQKNNIYACCLTPKNWFEHSSDYHTPGINKYLIEISKQFDLPIRKKRAFFSNNFICHKFIFFEFITKFREIFNYITSKYGFELDFKTDPGQEHRKAAYLYERVSMIYFSNRDDLNIIQIPKSHVQV